MVYDCFTFYNELDLLEIRMNILKDVVDKFVICEATVDHRGCPTRLRFAENRDRFAKFEDKIIYVLADDPPSAKDAVDVDGRGTVWAYESWHRDAISRGLSQCSSDDVLILSDIDEIPRPECILAHKNDRGITCLELGFYDFYFNFKASYSPWRRVMMLRYGYFCNELPRRPIFQEFTSCMGLISIHKASMQKLRYVVPDSYVPDAGWHFSYLGGVQMVLEKNKVQAERWQHSEAAYDGEWLAKRIYEGRGITTITVLYRPLLTLQGLPKYIVEHRAEYDSLFYHAPFLHCLKLNARFCLFKLLAKCAVMVRRVFGHAHIIQVVKKMIIR